MKQTPGQSLVTNNLPFHSLKKCKVSTCVFHDEQRKLKEKLAPVIHAAKMVENVLDAIRTHIDSGTKTTSATSNTLGSAWRCDKILAFGSKSRFLFFLNRFKSSTIETAKI